MLMTPPHSPSPMTFHPVEIARWEDVLRLFEHHGNPGYCWCMRWRVPSGDFQPLGSDGRRDALRERVSAGVPIGILGYVGDEPLLWCSVAPRETYVALERSRLLKRLDDAQIWSVVCFYLDRTIRGQGYTLPALRAAVDFAAAGGAQVVEGYPFDPTTRASGSYGWMGSPSLFQRAGFTEAARAENGRLTMRYDLR